MDLIATPLNVSWNVEAMLDFRRALDPVWAMIQPGACASAIRPIVRRTRYNASPYSARRRSMAAVDARAELVAAPASSLL